MSCMSELDAIRSELGLTEDQANQAIQGAAGFADAVKRLHDAAGEDSPVVLPPCATAEASTELYVDIESARHGLTVKPGMRLTRDDRQTAIDILDDVFQWVFDRIESEELAFDSDDAAKIAGAAYHAIAPILCDSLAIHAK